MHRKIKRKLISCIINLVFVVIGIIATKISVEVCREQRGGFFIGGEWFILPVILLAAYFIPAIIGDILNALEEEDE